MRKRERRRTIGFFVRAECCSHESADVLSVRSERIHPPGGVTRLRIAQRTNQRFMISARNSRMLMWSPLASIGASRRSSSKAFMGQLMGADCNSSWVRMRHMKRKVELQPLRPS
jgi:hypothetical protein